MLKRSLVILLIATSATLGLAEGHRKVHQPRLAAQNGHACSVTMVALAAGR